MFYPYYLIHISQVSQINLRKNLHLIDNNPGLSSEEKQKCKQSLITMHALHGNNGSQLSPSSGPSSMPNNMGKL